MKTLKTIDLRNTVLIMYHWDLRWAQSSAVCHILSFFTASKQFSILALMKCHPGRCLIPNTVITVVYLTVDVLV